ncbi:CPBP family intramembrane glutamic endopeptidase [Shouchella lehensis]|uniref:Abortive infection domain-containing protein n=2 Tax=Shouchella lehensis TaxID=300825 RepID=A0A060LT07_9BACI|nr:type II CAAX endopeptidase family protein [Shouchella lehensis]AIC93100.1 abortive infection domain-containing protein [Shouchella lehensis G1]TES49531.1 CPBP family intramembrane metalloprotease [Shouchella lehensis]
MEKQRPGWLEIIVLAIVYIVVVVVFSKIIVEQTSETPIIMGLSLSALSAGAGLCAFAAAYFLRIRKPLPFGLKKTTGKWLIAGAALGVAVYVSGVVLFSILAFFGYTDFTTQDAYREAATGGTLLFLLQLILIAVATPIGEEFAFRGVLTSALLRYGPWVSIIISSLIFAVAHGINEVLPIAFFTGLAAAYLFYRTGSVWPGVIVHCVNNGLATLASFIVMNFL